MSVSTAKGAVRVFRKSWSSLVFMTRTAAQPSNDGAPDPREAHGSSRHADAALGRLFAGTSSAPAAMLAPGAPHSAKALLAGWDRAVLEALAVRWPGDSRTSERMAAEASDLLECLAASAGGRWDGVTASAVLRWCWTSRTHSGSRRRASQSTARMRQWIARAVFAEAARLGAPVDPDAAAGERIAPPDAKPVKALTDVEADRVRKWADHAPQGSRQPLAVALAFAGGTAAEIARVRIGDIDLDKATVAFAGGAARVGPLDDWAAQAVRRYVGDNSPVAVDVPVCVSARTTPEREVESVSGLLRRVLRAAGLYELEGVTASSIRLNSARRVLHADGIAAAATFLGWTSLDRTADALRHNWKHPDG